MLKGKVLVSPSESESSGIEEEEIDIDIEIVHEIVEDSDQNEGYGQPRRKSYEC